MKCLSDRTTELTKMYRVFIRHWTTFRPFRIQFNLDSDYNAEITDSLQVNKMWTLVQLGCKKKMKFFLTSDVLVLHAHSVGKN